MPSILATRRGYFLLLPNNSGGQEEEGTGRGDHSDGDLSLAGSLLPLPPEPLT